MKKKGLIIASVLILVLSVFFMGCPPEEEETFDPAVPSSVLNILKTTIGYTGTFPVPADTNYKGYFLNDQNGGDSDFLAIWWTDADADKYAAYEGAWTTAGLTSVSLARDITMNESKNLNLGGSFIAKIAFTEEGGNKVIENDKIDYTVPPNSIYFTIYK